MTQNHGSEYQLRIVHEDGTEKLSGWINSEEQLVQEMAAVQRPVYPKNRVFIDL